MIPHVINEGSIMFVALKKPWPISSDHPNFAAIRDYLLGGGDNQQHLVELADVTIAIRSSGGGIVELVDGTLQLRGEALSAEWAEKAVSDPASMRVFQVEIGDRVRVEGDEDAPDGVYVVGDLDNGDTGKRVYVESEEDYFGFVSNESIKEIIK